jgi:uncharacterized membrane protein YoaK (UPF0700 family)
MTDDRAAATHVHERAGLAIAMAMIAGCVDGVGYFVLSHLFTAHMSGNSVAFGGALGQGTWTEVLRRGFPIPLFIIGVGTGGAIIEIGFRRGHHRTMSLLLGMEVLLLTAFVLGARADLHGGVVPSSGPAFYGLAAALTLAMGIQTAGLQRIGGKTVRTTYVTGMLTQFAEESVVFAFWLHDERAARGQREIRRWISLVRSRDPLNRAVLLAAIWTGYIAGAVTGGALDLRIHAWALTPAIAALVAVIAVDQRRPIHVPGDIQAAVGG